MIRRCPICNTDESTVLKHMKNMQELQTVVFNKLNIKIFLINNNGYHSIRQTQENLFKGQTHVGIGGGYGLSMPDFSKVIPAFGIPYHKIDSLDNVKERTIGMHRIIMKIYQ